MIRLSIGFLTVFGCVALAAAAHAAEADIFSAFTSHIRQQVQSDKSSFVAAQACTEWFYKDLRRRPPTAAPEGVSFSPGEPLREQDNNPSDCRRRYPDGLETARKDFSLTQSLLSVSLTFYQFALVGDRNDDARYSADELRDMLESFGLPFNEILPPSAHLAALNAQFDVIHRTTGLDALMAGMGALYDRGYRLTSQDQASLNQVLG